VFRDSRTKEEKQQARDDYLGRVLGEPDESLLRDDRAEQKKVLGQEIERLRKLVDEQSSSNKVTDNCNDLFTRADEELNEEHPKIYKVFNNIDRIKQRLIRAYDSREARPFWFPRIVGYNLIWFVGLVFLIVFFRLIPGQERLTDTAWVCFSCALWGGMGGVMDAFFAQHRHFADQDFDKAFLPWYYTHPVLGISMGAVVYLIIQAGLLAVSGLPLEEVATANTTTAALQSAVAANISAGANEAGEASKIGVTALPIAIAFLAGFRQRTGVDFLTRIITSIFSSGNRGNTEE
jgi:hypothetical protein